MTGEKGPIIEGHVDKETFKQDLAEAGVEVEKPAVKEFLEHITHDQRGIINMFDWKSILNQDMDKHLQEKFEVPNLKTGRMEPLISGLTDEEEEQFRNCIQRMNTLFTAARELDVRVMVDAEQTYFQPAISRITVEMMKKYNTQKAIVFNTYQVGSLLYVAPQKQPHYKLALLLLIPDLRNVYCLVLPKRRLQDVTP